MVLKMTQGLESELENFPQEDTNFIILWKVTFMVVLISFNLWPDLIRMSSQFIIYFSNLVLRLVNKFIYKFTFPKAKTNYMQVK